MPFKRDKPRVTLAPLPLPDKKIEAVPVPIAREDTVPPPVVHKETVVRTLDTATLRQWFDQAHFSGKYRTSIMDDERVLAVIKRMDETMEENEALVRQLIQSIEDKEKAEQEVKKIKRAIFDAPMYMLILHGLFYLVIGLVIYKIHYSRMRIQAYIDGRINKL